MKLSRWRSLQFSTVLGLGGFYGLASLAKADDVKPPLPLKRVVMLSSGVGYFEHAGKIEGDKQVQFPVKIDDVNDLLKSLVVQDRNGGQVTAVNYGSPEPISQTLKTLAIDITRNPTLAQIFHQLRGHKVELVTANEAKPIQGTIVGVERRRIPVGQQVVDSDLILLRTDAGLRTVTVDSVAVTKFPDAKIDQEFQQGLDLLVQSKKQDQKLIKVDFRGKGARDVSVGYVQESPVWKTTYRLVLGDKAPFLQGWAIVENTTAQDWANVDLTLMSGRPVSFQMALYQPLFVARPHVALQLHSAMEPRIYNQDLASREDEFLAAGQRGEAVAGSEPRRRNNIHGMGGMGGGMGGMGGGMGGMGMGGMGMGGMGGALQDPARPRDPMNLSQGIQSSANAEDIGESFRYVIKAPVTLNRNESAMLPIVNDAIKGDKVYIFNPTVHQKHPLAGLKLTNSTELHLQQGPITVFEDDEYAGDAQITDIPPGSTRLISYALDLDTEIVTTTKPEERLLTAMSIHNGGLIQKFVASRQHTYLIKNSGSRAKTVLIEQRLDDGWPKVEPAPTEKTRDLHRFAIKAEPGKPATLVVKESKELEERIVIKTLDVAAIELYIDSAQTTPAMKNVLKELIRRKGVLNDLSTKRATLASAIQEAITEQQRLRENFKALNDNDSLHKRYVQKLAAAEDSLEALRPKHAAARAEEAAYEKEFEKFASELTAN